MINSTVVNNDVTQQYAGSWQKDAIDYDIYDMNAREKVIGYLLGAGIGYLAVQIFFGIPLFSLIACIAAGFLGMKIYMEILCENRRKALILQFRDMLESLSTSVGTGKNMPEAFLDCLYEMKTQFEEDGYIVQELSRIIAGTSNNINIEVLVADFANRSHNEDIRAFSDVFTVAIRKGGNMKDIIAETKEVISDKILMQMEISSIIAGKKNELNIMILLPFIVVTQINNMMDTSGDLKVLIITFLVKLIALGMFVFAYMMGQKMMKIDI